MSEPPHGTSAHDTPEPPMLNYAPPAPRISVVRLISAWVLILGGVYFAIGGLATSNPSARANLLLMAFWFSVIGLYLRFRRPR